MAWLSSRHGLLDDVHGSSVRPAWLASSGPRPMCAWPRLNGLGIEGVVLSWTIKASGMAGCCMAQAKGAWALTYMT